MAQPEFPTLEESAVKIAGALSALRLDLLPSAGIGVAALPWDWTQLLQNWAFAHTEQLQEWRNIFPHAVDHLGAIASGYAQIVSTLDGHLAPLGQASWPTLCDSAALAAKALDDTLHPLRVCVCEGLWNLHGDLHGIETGIGDLNDSVRGALYRLIEAIRDKVVQVDVTASMDLGDAIEQLLAGARPLLAHFLPPAPITGDEEGGRLFGQQVEAWIAAADKIIGDTETRSPGILSWALKVASAAGVGHGPLNDKVIDTLAQTAKDAADPIAASRNPLWQKALGLVTGVANWLTEQGVATPDTVWQRALAAYVACIGLGLVAQGIAAVGSLDIAGCGDLNLGYITSLLGEFAGFRPLINAIQGTLYDVYLGVPMRHWCNRTARPFIPSVGDLMRFKYKRIFERAPEDPVQTPAPFTYAEGMAYWGYSDDWIKVYEDDLYREPMARDLLLMAEVTACTDEWWTYKIKRLGYSDTDAPIMVDAFKRRASRTQIMDLYRRLWYLASEGFISLDDFRERARETKIPEMALDFGCKAAQAELERTERRDLRTWATEQYWRDAIDDEKLRDLFQQVYADPDQADRAWRLELLKRYHRVWRVTPTEEARKGVALYRRAYLAGHLTEHEYRAHLTAAGLDGEALELTLALDSEQRDAGLLARFRTYRLPRLRDDLAHGLITLPQYRSALREAAFPEEYLDDEVALAEALFTRRQEQTVRTEQLPAYRRAYALGIFARGALRAAMEDAGVTPAGIEAELIVLDYQRDETERRRVEAAAREADAARREAQREQERLRKEQERQAEERRRAAERQRAQLQAQAAARAKADAAAAREAAEARRPGWPADVARVRSQIDSAYKRLGQTLPDDVWHLGLDLEDELQRLGGPDPDAVDALVGRIEMALARYAGVLPA